MGKGEGEMGREGPKDKMGSVQHGTRGLPLLLLSP